MKDFVRNCLILVLIANLPVIFKIKTTKVMAVVEMKSLFSTPMPSFLETPPRIQSVHQNELTEWAYEMINSMEPFVTDFQEFTSSTEESIVKIERLLWKRHSTNRIYQTTSRAITK